MVRLPEGARHTVAGSTRGWLMRSWPALAALYAWLVSTGGASLHLWRDRVAEGARADFPSIFLWQGLVYGLWIPIGFVLIAVTKSHGLGLQGLAAAAMIGLPAILLHAWAAAFLDTLWSPRVAQMGVAAAMTQRLPIDMLIYMVLVGAIWGLAAYRRAGALAAALAAAQKAMPAQEKEDQPLLVSLGSRRVPVPLAAVEWLGSAGNYVVVNWDGRDGLVRSTLAQFEEKLDPSRFARIHRSTIANLAMVESASALSDGSWRLTMKSGAELVASRSYRDQILDRLGRR